MGLFKKKCEHCNDKIDRGNEVFRDVKDPLFKEKREKSFCCEEHADDYEEESANAKKCCGCCS